jgi:hypothetical protein
MNVTLYKQMLEDVKQDLAYFEQAHGEMETLAALWQRRMTGHAHYQGVLKDISEAAKRNHRDVQGLELLCRYLQQRLANQEPEVVVEFGDDGYPVSRTKSSPSETEEPPRNVGRQDTQRAAGASQGSQSYYDFGPQGFPPNKPKARQSTRQTKETQVDFEGQKTKDTIHFDADGNPITHYITQNRSQPAVNSST